MVDEFETADAPVADIGGQPGCGGKCRSSMSLSSRLCEIAPYQRRRGRATIGTGVPRQTGLLWAAGRADCVDHAIEEVR
jgi:hypothetical protein